MVFHRKKKNNASSRRYKKFSKRRPRIPRGGPFPNTLVTSLNYGRQIESLNILAGGKADIFFLANGLNPFNSLPGQPPGAAPIISQQASILGNVPLYQGMQIYSQLYATMAVISNKVKFKFMGDSTGAAGTYTNLQLVFSAWPASKQTTANFISAKDTSILMMQKGTKSRILSSNGGKNYANFTAKRTTSKMTGIKDIQDSDELECTLNNKMSTATSDAISNPFTQWYYHIRIQNLNTDDAVVSWSVYSTQLVRFTRRTLWQGEYTTAFLDPPPPV